MSQAQFLTVEHCRRLLMSAQGEPARGGEKLRGLLLRLGFVQVDSINVLERAHHLTLRSRMKAYRPEHLSQLLAKRLIFEHWTHDASLIPVEFLRYWRYRATLYPEYVQRRAWWKERLGPDPAALVARVKAHVAASGPITSREFESESKGGAWWGWKPEKTALEYLWRAGDLAIASRQGFVKVYDLSERVFPEAMVEPLPTGAEYLEWAFGAALERLGAATPRELADFWGGLDVRDALEWCVSACARGAAIEAELEGAGAGVAVLDWAARVEGLRLPGAVRILNPFDPLVRDRKRASRLFGFDYSFEAYVPAPKRIYGYFVLPVLERDRFIARLDCKHHRDRGELEVKGLWWESGVRVTAGRRAAVERSVSELAAWLGASVTAWTMPLG